ncbi:hypothetical protein NECAME_14235 [Necator americanus]|uniref:Receptor L-domain domain-containing protein n=1 Tax=Necator americanus TaxID=51031 RepID=W2SRB6_NECAM|nr:hypothetical protein NECAME_14235 [Necator americanus]ETN71396.1 hypothetical protein NECAME_14235 [Necator americanus]
MHVGATERAFSPLQEIVVHCSRWTSDSQDWEQNTAHLHTDAAPPDSSVRPTILQSVDQSEAHLRVAGFWLQSAGTRRARTAQKGLQCRILDLRFDGLQQRCGQTRTRKGVHVEYAWNLRPLLDEVGKEEGARYVIVFCRSGNPECKLQNIDRRCLNQGLKPYRTKSHKKCSGKAPALIISENADLVDISALPTTEITGKYPTIMIKNNPKLCDNILLDLPRNIGKLEQLEQVNGRVLITDNSNLQELTFLKNIKRIENPAQDTYPYSLMIYGNSGLSKIEFCKDFKPKRHEIFIRLNPKLTINDIMNANFNVDIGTKEDCFFNLAHKLADCTTLIGDVNYEELPFDIWERLIDIGALMTVDVRSSPPVLVMEDNPNICHNIGERRELEKFLKKIRVSVPFSQDCLISCAGGKVDDKFLEHLDKRCNVIDGNLVINGMTKPGLVVKNNRMTKISGLLSLEKVTGGQATAITTFTVFTSTMSKLQVSTTKGRKSTRKKVDENSRRNISKRPEKKPEVQGRIQETTTIVIQKPETTINDEESLPNKELKKRRGKGHIKDPARKHERSIRVVDIEKNQNMNDKKHPETGDSKRISLKNQNADDKKHTGTGDSKVIGLNMENMRFKAVLQVMNPAPE